MTMTEQEWLACADPQRMLEFLRGKANLRKLRLLAVAGCRQIWQGFRSNRSRRAVEVSERYADDLATAEELHAAHDEALLWYDLIVEHDFEGVALARLAAEVARVHLSPTHMGTPDLLRDIFGNPFHPQPMLDPSLLTVDALTVAQTIYDARDFGRMAELATLLEAAGCTDAEILSHLRGEGPHAKGCWALDVVLQKE